MYFKSRIAGFPGAALAAFILFNTSVAIAMGEPSSPVDAVRDSLSGQVHHWSGNLYIQYPDHRNEVIPAVFEFKKANDNRFTATMILKREGDVDPDQEMALQWVFQVLPGGIWNARIGDLGPFEARVYKDNKGKLSKSNIMWVGPNSTFEMLFKSDKQELAIVGFLPVPAQIANGPVWADLRLKRARTLFTIGTFDINIWECLGIFGGLLFGLRFVVQIIASERAKRSVIPEAFWWISLIATGAYTVYGFYFQRFAVILAQAMAWYVYVRNLILLRAARKKSSDPTS